MREGKPNLMEMDEHEARNLVLNLFTKMSPEEEYELRHEEYVMEMPQSGERIRGRDKMRAFQQAYPNPPTIELRRLVMSKELWVIEASSDYDGRTFHAVLIWEFRDGRIERDTRFYAEPFAAPDWRKQWVEDM